MRTFLFIPWFKFEAIEIPLLYLAGAVFAGCALAAANPKWRQQAMSTALFAAGMSLIALWKGFDPVPIQPFGILVATGVVLGTKLAEWYAKRLDIDPHILSDFATHVVFIGFIFAILLNAVFYETDDLLAFFQDPTNNLKWMGLSSYGGFVGAIIGVWVWRKRRKMPAWALADAVGFAFPLGWMFGRSGCFVVHDHPGAETDFFLAVDNYNNSGVARHDLGFYEVIYATVIMVIFLVILRVYPREKRPMGLWVGLMPLLYTPGRFMLDFLRIQDQAGADVRFSGLTPAQYASIAMFIMAIGLLIHIFKNPKWHIPDRMRLSLRQAGEKKSEPDADVEDADDSMKTDDKPSASAKRRKTKKKR
ncbi:MAG: phosphatidylglycerol:prolipoprotein diacylglycerol transferase [Polyangiales bacterium]|jgi:phosphatidylglycerol:prolipoprotein diacylglycerol transferase